MSSSVDTGGGLVVVCMTSFASVFGVTSYVRLLNCYMGHQHSPKNPLMGKQVRIIRRPNENLRSEVCGENLPGKAISNLQ